MTMEMASTHSRGVFDGMKEALIDDGGWIWLLAGLSGKVPQRLKPPPKQGFNAALKRCSTLKTAPQNRSTLELLRIVTRCNPDPAAALSLSPWIRSRRPGQATTLYFLLDGVQHELSTDA